MKLTDMRKLSPAARQERRMQVIKLRNQGWTYEDIARQLGLSRTGVFDISQRYQAQGEPALQDKRCGRPLGTLRALSADQERETRQLLIDKTPDGLQLDFALWSRPAVQQLIKQRCALKLTLQSVGKVFLILDNLKVHHARQVQAWLQDNKEHIEVFYLPSYSPELNPNELLNANLKAAITTQAPARRKGQLKEAAIGHLRHLQKSPKKVQQFFGKDSVKYAA